MFEHPKRWFTAQFVQSHTRRDVDLEHWWQLPDDATRTTSPWLQLVVDLVAPATFSEWHEKVAESRVKAYDKLRPPVTRVVFLLLIIAALQTLGAPWWSWVMLVPAALQVLLEIYLHKYVPDSAPEPRWRLVRRMRDMVSAHFQTMLLNVTGVLGILACPLNVVAVGFTPAGDAQGWIKIAALAAAIFYLNSGLASAFLDPPNYTENSVMPPVMHWVRPYAPLISYGVVTAVVALSAALHRWPPGLTPLAYLTAALTLLLGGTIRNHDRMVAAAAPVARDAVEAGRIQLGRVVHDDLGPAKAAAESASRVNGVALKDAVELQALSAFLTHFNTRTGIFASQRMELRYLVRKLIGPYGISPREVTYDIDWDTAHIRKEDHQIAIRMATALVHNVGQTLQRDSYLDVPKSLVVECHTTGDGRELRYHLAVRDHLPAMNGDEWCTAGGTLAALRSWLREEFNGDLTQEIIGDGTKRITASWSDRPPITGYGDPQLGREPA
ncbi:putative integral membrane protein [Mycolicibacterium rhodesiae JS60]|nr:putative integral membrane protein [Mycolicibacterium rhodesiae JS60]